MNKRKRKKLLRMQLHAERLAGADVVIQESDELPEVISEVVQEEVKQEVISEVVQEEVKQEVISEVVQEEVKQEVVAVVEEKSPLETTKRKRKS